MSAGGFEGEESEVKVRVTCQLRDGRYLSGSDSEFLDQVLEDVQNFDNKGIRDSVLIFPPFKNFHRFLVHNLVEENFGELCTFSVGHSPYRRTVVCFKDLRLEERRLDDDKDTCGSMGIEQRTSDCHEDDVTPTHPGRKKAKVLPDVALYQPPALRRTREATSKGAAAPLERKPSKQRRPDIAVYVPRALRGLELTRQAPAEVKESKVVEMSTAVQEERSEPESTCVVLPPQCEESATVAVGGRRKEVCVGVVPPVRGGDRPSAVAHWEELLVVEEGGAVGGELVDEVVAAVGRVSVVERPKADYSQYRTDDAPLSLAELTHVVELFGFPAEFKTHDLVSILSTYGSGFEIKWVDDTHALAVFSSSFVAADVLHLHHPMLKTRAMEEASAPSRAKAKRICESLRVPYRPRPETCAALAQRLITGALGVHHRQSKAEREEERRLLREAREKRRSAAREREAAWEGTIGGS